MARLERKYAKQVLEETPPRVAKLLNGIGAEPMVRALLSDTGMTDEDIAEGGKLLLACWTQLPAVTIDPGDPGITEQQAAATALEEWDDPHFARLGATLKRHFPDAGEYVFHALGAAGDMTAAMRVDVFLRRLDALEKGSNPSRSSSRKEDKQAVALLARRGLDKKERARLGELVEEANRLVTSRPPGSDTGSRDAARDAALTALKDWYEEWAAAARAVVKKRSHLIRLGLATRKSRRKKQVEAPK